MKNFINDKEDFIISIPDCWQYSQEKADENIDKQPYTFIPYDISDFSFQISYFESTSNKTVFKNQQPKGQNNIVFIENNVNGIRSWMAEIKEGGIILLSLSYDPTTKPEILAENIEKAKNSVNSLVIFDAITRDVILPRIKWDKFMLAYGATVDLVNRAYKSGSSFELVILSANQIDALLRQSIILTTQLKERSNVIDVSLIHQGEKDKPIFEKEVYKKALNSNIISQELFDELFRLYNIRNKAVHRYIISDIKTNDIIELAYSYIKARRKVGETLMNLEKEQFDKQIGIHKGNRPPNAEFSDEDLERFISNIKDKHQNRKINKEITIKKNDG